MKSILRCLVAVVALAKPVVSAQQSEEEPGIRLRAVAFQLETPLGDVYAHDPASTEGLPGVKLAVKGYLNHEFDTVAPKGTNLVVTTKPDPGSVKSAADLVARIQLPARLRSGILLFLPGSGKAGDPKCRVLVVDDRVGAFPRGSFKVFNLSPQPVRIQLEKKNFDFKSGETRLIEDPPVGENQTSGMLAFSHRDGEWRRFGSGIWPHPGQKRSLQIVYENPRSKQIEMRGIRDIAVPGN